VAHADSAMPYISDTVIRHNEIKMKTGSGQWSIIEQAPSTNIVRYMNNLGYTTGAPTGNGIQGDVYWNSDPGSSEPIGWVCIVSGSPAAWRGFGTIAVS